MNTTLDALNTTMNPSNKSSVRTESCADYPGDWCWEAEEGDYKQIFYLVLAIVLMHLASYCLGYARSSVTIGGMSEMVVCSTYIDVEKMKKLKTDDKVLTSKYNQKGTVSGIPMSVYMVLNAFLSVIYFIIKVWIYESHDSHYLSGINEEFDEVTWAKFYDARIILLSTMYCHSFSLLKQNVSVYNEAITHDKWQSGWGKGILVVCCVVMFVDFIGSIVLMLIAYPLIFTALYHGAVGILTAIACVFIICCLVPLMVCYAKCVSCIFTCNCRNSDSQSACHTFMRGIANGFVLLSLYYIYFCVVLLLCFVFLGGPNHTVLYLDSGDKWIVIAYAAAMGIGIIGFIIGMINTACTVSNTAVRCKPREPDLLGLDGPRV
eukprot:574278_1